MDFHTLPPTPQSLHAWFEKTQADARKTLEPVMRPSIQTHRRISRTMEYLTMPATLGLMWYRTLPELMAAPLKRFKH